MIDVCLYWESRSGVYAMASVPRIGEFVQIERKLYVVKQVLWSVDIGVPGTNVSVTCIPASEGKGQA